MMHGLAAWLIGLAGLVGGQPAGEPPAEKPVAAEPGAFADARALLTALGERDKTIDTLTGQVRLTGIQALQGDLQRRFGTLALRTLREGEVPVRQYAVTFEQLQIDTRVENINEQFVFDGRWLVERMPDEKQFIKREIVPAGQVLDPMDLMRDAPFWVSVGDDADLVLKDYEAELLPVGDGLVDNTDTPELAGLMPLVAPDGCVQLKLTPREGSPGQDDWESVRMWFTPDSLLPRLYVKTAWTGDMQIAELFGVEVNGPVETGRFETTTPAAGSGWQVQISAWRGRADQ
tara:strand:- start:5 stop:871 length:867 start_codon:yes stop_codon:yes gene_type:complete